MTDTLASRSIPPAPTLDDLRSSPSASAMPPSDVIPATSTRNYFQAIDNMMKVFAIRPGERVLFLTDPRLDRRVVDMIAGIAASRGATCQEFMGTSTQLTEVPEEAKPALANADFVARAPEEVVEENRERLADAEASKAKLEAALARLGDVV